MALFEMRRVRSCSLKLTSLKKAGHESNLGTVPSLFSFFIYIIDEPKYAPVETYHGKGFWFGYVLLIIVTE